MKRVNTTEQNTHLQKSLKRWIDEDEQQLYCGENRMDDDNLDLNSNYLVVMKNSHLRCEMTIIIFKHYQERVVLSSGLNRK